MNKDVIISVVGTQSMDDNDMSTMELVTEGKFYKKDNAYYVTYKESEVTGMAGTTTTLKIADDIVTLLRFGTVNTQFVFEQGQKHMAYYDTDNGALTIGVFTNEINVNLNDSGGEISVGYEVEINNLVSGINGFRVCIREAGGGNNCVKPEAERLNES